MSDLRVPLVLVIPQASVDAWNEIAEDIPAEEYADGIIDDDLNANQSWWVERA